MSRRQLAINQGEHDHHRRTTNVERLLRALGVDPLDWQLDQKAIELDAKGWLEKRLLALGWTRE